MQSTRPPPRKCRSFSFKNNNTMYKLINTKAKEETLCEKVMIDGFDYYVSGKETKWAIDENNKLVNLWFYPEKLKGFVLATNNPNMDIPKVVDEVDLLSYINKLANQRFTGWTNDEMKGYKTALISITEFYKSKKTHPFSEEDAVEFGDWIRNNPYVWNYPDKLNDRRTTKELLQIWKEQQPKIVYYGK